MRERRLRAHWLSQPEDVMFGRRLWHLVCLVWTHPMNAGGRLDALCRVLRWQLASRLMTGPIGMPYVDDTYLFALRGMTGATGNWYCGLHEVHEMAFVLHMLRAEEEFVDIGANIGSYTVLAAGGTGAKVTSVEPIPSTFKHLKRNVELNGLTDKVRCCQVGLSEGGGLLRFSTGLDTVNHVVADGENLPSIDVPVTRLDDLLAGTVPVLIKIDVEGHERAVLRGGERTLGDPRLLAVIMETNGSGARYGVSDHELVEIMRRHGFEPFGYDPFARRLEEAAVGNGNTIFVRDRAAVEDRVWGARRFRLVNGEI